MKICPLSLLLAFGAITLGSISPVHAREVGSNEKIALTRSVLQVLPDGLLFMGGGSVPFILVGHPKAKTIAEGERVNCYVKKTEGTYKYTDTRGAERTVRVYRYQNERIGK